MLIVLHIVVLAIGLSSNCQRVIFIKQVSCRNQLTLPLLGKCMRIKTPRPLAMKCLSELQGDDENKRIGLNLRSDKVEKLILDAENRAISNKPLESGFESISDSNDMCEDRNSGLLERIAEDINRQEFEESQHDSPSDPATEISPSERAMHDALQVYLVIVIVAYSAAGFFAVHQYVQHINLNFYLLDVACIAAVAHMMVTKGIITSNAYKRLSSFRKMKNLKPNEYLIKTLQIEEME